MIPLLAFAATIELECKDVSKVLENIDKVKIVYLNQKQKKEVKEALEAFTVTEECPDID
tara:strand:- start:60 stop:236 length:177 start_codon:yes stop_codon:yes gene_type:complete